MRNTGTDDIRTEIRDWLRARLAEELEVPVDSIAPANPMSSYGLDSVRAIILLADVEDHLGIEIDPNALWEFPTVDAFTELLVGELAETDGAHAAPSNS